MWYYVFIDNSNVWIEGQYVSAVKKGHAVDLIDAHYKKVFDPSWYIDFGKLLYYITDGEIQNVKKAVIIGSKPTDKDSLWEAMRKAGFEVSTYNRNSANREKKVDTGIVAQISKTLYKEAQSGDRFILVSGDTDYVPIIENINEEGIHSTIAFWDNVSGELKATARDYKDLTSGFESITYV